MSVLALSAFGDALGAPYEFGEYTLEKDLWPKLHPYGESFPDPPNPAGLWTDDTAQALSIVLAYLDTQHSPAAFLDEVVRNFVKWYQEDGEGVGMQTSAVLSGFSPATVTAEELSLRAKEYSDKRPDSSAGNGSLMRVHPVALFPLEREEAASVAVDVTFLTHADFRCSDASVLWVEMLREARATGELRPTAGLDLIREEAVSFWEEAIETALTTESSYFGEQGWWVVPTFQQALSAVSHNLEKVKVDPLHVFQEILACEPCDTDTVAATAGGLMGALGASITHLPQELVEQVHGSWPEKRTLKDLRLLEAAMLSA